MRWWFLIIMTVFASTSTAEIYRWTDDNGQVHYGQRPAGDHAQRLEIRTESPATSSVQPVEAERRARQQRLLDAYEYEREQKAQQAARAAHEARQQAVQCEQLRNQLRRLDYGGPIYFQTEGGERRYLDDDQRAAEITRLGSAYRKACGAPPE